MRSSSILIITLIRKQEHKSTIIERVRHDVADDPVTSFKWISRMNCYLEGSSKGLLRVRDIEKKGECFLQLPSGCNERI